MSIERRLRRLEQGRGPQRNLTFYFLDVCDGEVAGYGFGDTRIEREPGERLEALRERVQEMFSGWQRGKVLVFLAYCPAKSSFGRSDEQ